MYLAIWLKQLEKIYKVEFSFNSLYCDSRYKPAQSHIIMTYYFWVFKTIKVSGYDLNSQIVCWRQFVVLKPGVNVNDGVCRTLCRLKKKPWHFNYKNSGQFKWKDSALKKCVYFNEITHWNDFINSPVLILWIMWGFLKLLIEINMSLS